MKKLIKIFALILFLMFGFGITTSKALTVTTTTSANSMISALNRGEGLTGISGAVRRGNDAIYCRQHGTALSGEATYYYVNKSQSASKKVYPGEDKNGNGKIDSNEREENGEYIAYVLAGGNYTKAERQEAIWYILGQGGEKNDCAKVATGYQHYKKNEVDFNVTNSNAKVTSNSGKNIYGPLKIQYSYYGQTETPAFHFGGFNYVFLDSNNRDINANTKKVKLCTLNGSTYTEVTSTKNNSTGYYEVRTSSYNNTNLYVVTEDNTISNVKLKIQYNSENYTAEVYQIQGKWTANSTYTVYCASCDDKLQTAPEATTNALANAVKTTGSVVKYNGKYYEYVQLIDESIQGGDAKNVYDLDGTYINASATYYRPESKTTTTYSFGGVTASTENAIASSFTEYKGYCCSTHGAKYRCTYCHTNVCGNDTSSENHKSGICVSSSQNEAYEKFFANHAIQKHTGTVTKRYRYVFEEYSGCGCAYTVYDGKEYPSQDLFIVTGTPSTTPSEEIYIDIPLYTEIEITKNWNDYSNAYSKRPSDLDLTVYRSTNGSNWTKLTEGTDYKISAWTKNGNTWTIKITELKRADDNGNQYYFKVEETNVPDYYEVVDPNGDVVDKNTNPKKITIDNELTKIDIPVFKVWDDYDNYYGTRSDSIQLEVYRRTNGGNWTKLTEGTDYTINWDKTSNPWKATIVGLNIKDNNGNLYDFKVVETGAPEDYVVLYSSTDGIISSGTTDKTLTITNELTYTEIEVEKTWDDKDNAYQTRPTSVKLEVYRQVDGQSNWEGPLKEGTDYNITWTNTGTDNWKATITDLKIADENRNLYHFMVKEIPENGGTGSTHYYNPSYETDVNGTTKTGNYVEVSDKEKDIKINNKLRLVELTITKIWDDYSDYYGKRPDNINLVVSRSTNGQNWEELTAGEDYTITWTKNGDTWVATIGDLLEVDANGNPYYFKVQETAESEYYEIIYSNNDGIISADATSKTLTITNELAVTEIDVEKIWDEQGTNYGTRPTSIKLEVYRQIDGQTNWEGPLVEGTDYEIVWTDTNTDNWKAKITGLAIANIDRKPYHFMIKEASAGGTTGSIHYYSATYKTVVNSDNGNETKTDNYVRISDKEKDLTITNTLRLVDLSITKVWDDIENRRNTRPDSINVVVSRSTNKQNWEQLTAGKDYTISWTQNGDTWSATINDLLEVDANGNLYYFKVEEILDDKRYEITYSTNGAVIDTSVSTDFTITNTLKLVDISVTKQWEDFNEYHDVRPEDIELEVYRSINGQNWEGPLVEGTDYDTIEWTKNGNTWTATIPNLLEVDYNGNTYQYQVKEKDQNYYNVKYLSGNSTDTTVNNYQTTITNELKYVDLEFTKEWRNSEDTDWDYSNEYGLRPDKIEITVYRSTNNQNWEALTEGKDYELTWTSTGSTDNTWTAKITQLLGVNSRGEEYYFKVEEKPLEYYEPVYDDSIKYDNEKWKDTDFEGRTENYTIKNKLKKINLSGYVWLDGQTGIKPPTPYNGIMNDSEEKLANIVVHLMWVKPQYLGGGTVEVAQTVTDENGYYEFKDIEIGYYYVEFDYDGIHFEDTIKVENEDEQKISKAFEDDNKRNAFNSRFETITYKKSNDGTTLNYNYADKKSTLITTQNGSTKISEEFVMNAVTDTELRKTDTEYLNLGLVKRGTDIALSTDVYDAKVTINGQETNYQYNKDVNTIDIGTTQTSETASYNLNLYASDYNYRIRNYISNNQFAEEDYINSEDPAGLQSGDVLKVYVQYELNLQNQSTEDVRINEVVYDYDEKYTFKEIVGGGYNVTDNGNTVTINLNGLSLGEGETQTLYLVFEVENNGALSTGEFSNKAEITSYSTDEGFIDVDSQPGNFVNNNEVEDDNDTAGGLTITVPSDLIRKITGKVFDNDNSQDVKDAIVQLIELKPYNGKVYEYIWQETTSGSGTGKRMNLAGDALETYNYTTISDGYYEFSGFIPGDYIVRFIYGDGTTYDMTGNVIKYNGQDYKSMADSSYNAEWYNTASSGASVARDNEARRLETMAYSVEIDAKKGLLLKLLSNPTTLNLTEKETLISIYNECNDVYGTSDITYTNITDISDDVINSVKEALLLREVLPNTWMCAETSKIKIAVDTETINNTSSSTTVNGSTGSYVKLISNVNLGLEQRPVTKMELKKYITGFKLIAANGQTLVNASVDVNEYLNGTTDISNKVQGIRDNLTVLGNVWQYEVIPTELNTVIDGANLEFEYTLVVENTGEKDYLSAELATAYNNNNIATYRDILAGKVDAIKGTIRSAGYNTGIGGAVGTTYYTGNASGSEVTTEITNIRDYINNDLSFVVNGDKVSEDAGPVTHRILTDTFSMQTATINTILKTVPTGKMLPGEDEVMYTVTLGKNPISATGSLSFGNYIAEVMTYTNAAGRRAIESTPGNAEIIDTERRTGREHEIDEADTGRIQIGAATGEDEATNYIIIIAVAVGIAVVAIGAYVVKKYFLK